MITAYFLWVWRYLLSRDETLNPKFGHRSEIWVFYSWFFIGVFGLNIAQYGLAGVEAGMLQERFWSVRSLAGLVQHSGESWASPYELWQCLKTKVKRGDKNVVLVGPLWFTLALISLAPFIALPLSGLCFELSDGYVDTGAKNAPVIGRTLLNFNQRANAYALDNLKSAWKVGFPPAVPGIGIAYTPPDVARSDFKSFSELPNTLPISQNVSRLFLGQQGSTPITGVVWGLMFSYNCSVVRSASEFTILSQNTSSFLGGGDVTQLATPSGDHIFAFNTSSLMAYNIWAYSELGMSNEREKGYQGNESFLTNDGASDRLNVLEYALWQVRTEASYGELTGLGYQFNDTIDVPITDLGAIYNKSPNGSYVINRDRFNMRMIDSSYWEKNDAFRVSERIIQVAEPIGVRCVRGSEPGTAYVDAATSTYKSFQGTPNTPMTNLTDERTWRFGYAISDMMPGNTGYFNLFSSTTTPGRIT